MKKMTVLWLLLALLPAWAKGPYKFLASGAAKREIIIVNEKSEVIWSHKMRTQCNDVAMLGDGKIFYSYSSGAKIINAQHEVLWDYKVKRGEEVHTASVLDDGYLIGILGKSPRLIEFDKNMKERLVIPIQTKTRRVHEQFRNARRTPQGTYLVPYMQEHKVCEYDRNGKVLRTIKAKGPCFGALPLKNGNILISEGDASSLVEVDKGGNRVWELSKEVGGIPLRFVAGVHVLSNGNYVISNWSGHGYKGRQAQVLEVNKDKELVWSLFDNKKFRLISTIEILDQKARSGSIR